MGEVVMEDVERQLVEWGKWVWVGMGRMYSGVSTGGGGTPDITDDEAIRIDRIIAQLRQADATMGNLVIDHYRYEMGYRFLADKYGMKPTKVSNLMARSKAFVQGALTNFSQAA